MATNKSDWAVYLNDDQGVVHCILPGEDIPGWAEIDNPYVTGEANQAAQESDSTNPPPKAGKGSGEDKWRAYAEEHGVDVSGADDRAGVIDALEAAGVPTE